MNVRKKHIEKIFAPPSSKTGGGRGGWDGKSPGYASDPGNSGPDDNHGQKKTRRNLLIVDCFKTKNVKSFKSMMVLKSFKKSFIWALSEHSSFKTLVVMIF